VSLRLYPHAGLGPSDTIDELVTQGALGSEHGFDGVMISEHHDGFAGYLPNPLQLSGWCLDAMDRGWAAACPLLLPLRPTALVAEEVAWLAQRFPGRVGLGVAAGALPSDFSVMGLTMDGLTDRFTDSLELLAGMLRGTDPGPLPGDAAIAACADHPVPLLSAAMGFTAVRRAARLRLGLLFDSLSTPERCRVLTDAYRAEGGTAPCVAVRRAWIGEPPRGRTDAQLDVYRTYSSRAAQAHWGGDELVGAAEAEGVAAGLLDVAERAGIDALNIRLHVPGVAPGTVREQIERLGHEVVPRVRDTLRTRVGVRQVRD
jgi:alkanesulfonate monooxygenase SsuD/methylene tetrahydromethanopterin reductase-like flavin-dependent oxidoreductase (luciferase family)